MKKIYVLIVLSGLVIACSMCNKSGSFPEDGYDDRLSGGSFTVLDASTQAFKQAIDGLSERQQRVHTIGDGTFDQVFVAAPAPHFGGLGPVFNNLSCINCHRNDGGGFPSTGSSNSGMLLRISVPGMDEHGGPLAAPGFGGQIQDQALLGAAPEASASISYTDLPVTYPDGTTLTLRKPAYALQNSYIALPGSYMLSPRLAPRLVGLGLLENIPESTILSFVDAGDQNGDGITGRANYVYDGYTKKTEIGRFGLKANTSTLLMQVATAYQQDMGVTSYAQPQESAYGQSQMSAVGKEDTGDELVDSLLNYVTFYVQTLAVPARRNVLDSINKRGYTLFNQINCSGCHRPTIQTGVNAAINLSSQRIHPYTDLLVHDMGEGLADNRPDYLATGKEWRTTPLWGIGLLAKTNGGTPYFLHDGRARTIEEAIVWHDGEAAKSKQQFMQLNKADRNALLQFLNSL
ncbi:MAG TPA: di-heme oxidoredictase family protein [Puia sp.]|nr:di-heme oxidoredictase family protein [Puia sp.]